jgi:glycosyltransferase involved in cell wall biosynthesis
VSPLVSIYIPLYNAGDFLETTLDSVRAQTFTDWECIIVDDASGDEGPAIAQRYVNQDSRFRLYRISLEDKRPFPYVRNVALEKATGKWIAPLDSDDWWDPGKLQIQLDALNAKRQAVWSYHGMRMVRDGQVINSRISHDPEYGKLDQLLLTNNIIHSSTMFLREKAMSLQGYRLDMHRAQDWDLWLRLLLAFGSESIVCVPAILGNYRVHTTNISTNYKTITRCERLLIRRMWFSHGLLLRKPVTSLKMFDAQLLRELDRKTKAGQRIQARLMAMLAILLRPHRKWRWKQFADI